MGSAWGRFPTIHLVLALWIIVLGLFYLGTADQRDGSLRANTPYLVGALAVGGLAIVASLAHWWRNRAQSSRCYGCCGPR